MFSLPTPGRTLAVLVMGLIAFAATPPLAEAQALRLTTQSREAETEFRGGLNAIENLLVMEGVQRLQRAVNADPHFALARALYAQHAPGLSAAARDAQLQQAAADAMKATVAELSLVLAMRATEQPERRNLLKAAADAAPDDRHVLYLYTSSLESATARARGFELIIRRFPDFAPAYRELGLVYARELLELPTALTHVQRYLTLGSGNPYAHHAVAEVLQRARRYGEATEHYTHAIDLDTRFIPGYVGLAEVALLEGKPVEARTHYDHAITMERSASGRMRLRALQALTHIADGNARIAMRELTQVANEADTTGFHAMAAQMHRQLAVLEATYGNRGMVDSRIRKAASLSPPGNVQQEMYAAAAYALAGDVRGARPIVKELNEVASNTSSAILKRQILAISALVEASADNTQAGLAAAKDAGPNGGLAKAILAEHLKRTGKLADAQALANEVLAITEVDLFAMIARQLAASN